ncbi:MAG: response regulator [Candidatus Omnitrophota bacterium]
MDKILLVEDERLISDVMARFLQQKGFHVDTAYTLQEGLDKYSTDHIVVLLDIALGNETSFPLLKKIKEENPKTIVIMVSGRSSEENIREATKLGADAFVSKPFKREYLEYVILSKIRAAQKEQTGGADSQ